MHQSSCKVSAFLRRWSVIFCVLSIIVCVCFVIWHDEWFPDETMAMTVTPLVVMVLFFGWLAYVAHGQYTKCPGCQKTEAMQEQSRVTVLQTEVNHKERVNENGKTYTRLVPYLHSIVHIHRKCKHCGFEDFLEHEEKTRQG